MEGYQHASQKQDVKCEMNWYRIRSNGCLL